PFLPHCSCGMQHRLLRGSGCCAVWPGEGRSRSQHCLDSSREVAGVGCDLDRFHLKAHMEKREMPVYDLVIAKGGSKLKEATADEGAKGSRMMGGGGGKIEAVGAQLTSL